MNKKIIFFGILAVFILTTISFASALGTSSKRPVVKKESPLFGIRAKQAVKERVTEIKSSFLDERIFILPFNFFIISSYDDGNGRNTPTASKTCPIHPTCACVLGQNNLNLPAR